MQSRQNVVDFPSGFQEFASYQDPEEAAPAPAANPWEEMEPNGYGWDTHTPVDSHIEPTVPFFIEVPQVPQIPTLYAPPESSLPHPDQQLTGPAFGTSASDPSGSADVAVRVLLNAVQDDQTQARRQLSARRRSKDPAKRRELNSKKGTQLAALRQTLGVSPGTTKLGILNTAIERLRGRSVRTEALAYLELHQLTGQRGRLKHVECLQAVDDMLNGRYTGDEVPHV